MRKILVHILLLTLLLAASSVAQSSGSAGAFARLGFGARGMGMGNALSAVNSGAVSTYYNPALAAFSEERIGAATVGVLSLDRYLNFLSYTQALPPHAGLSVGIINAGVRYIDGRDNDGYHTEDYSTMENQFYLSFANRVDERVALGVSVKMYYAKLFDQVTTTTVGFDVGILVKATDELSIGAVAQDINSKYKWDTKSIYDQNGKITEDKFPILYRFATAYKIPGTGAIVAGEFEHSSDKTNILRFGAEYNLMEHFSLRGGADRWGLGDNTTGVKPTFGFTAKSSFNGWTPAVNYAFVIEGFVPHGMHIITLTVAF